MKIFKSKPLLLTIISGMWLFSGCQKLTLDEALPVVSVKSVSMISGDSAAVTGTVVNTGADIVGYEGVCYSSTPMPGMLDNQYFIENSTIDFTVHVPLKQDSTYYIRVYAVNSFGYGISDQVKYTASHAKPAVAPCPLTSSLIVDQGNSYNVDNVVFGTNYASYGVWGLEVDYNNSTVALKMDFNKVPTNGAYVVQGDASQFSGNNNPHEVYAERVQFSPYSFQSGDSVYVSENVDKSISFSFCSLHYLAGSSKINLAGQFTAR